MELELFGSNLVNDVRSQIPNCKTLHDLIVLRTCVVDYSQLLPCHILAQNVKFIKTEPFIVLTGICYDVHPLQKLIN